MLDFSSSKPFPIVSVAKDGNETILMNSATLRGTTNSRDSSLAHAFLPSRCVIQFHEVLGFSSSLLIITVPVVQVTSEGLQ